ncbi:hypothetical protein KEJ39_01460 [Candidatus Bathyarchaeota archaeon]|nr:hypothetical protein [Candidatus Bathyarchaeota archaeon]
MAVDEAQEKFSHFLKLSMNSVELDEWECAEALVWGVRKNTTYYDSV